MTGFPGLGPKEGRRVLIALFLIVLILFVLNSKYIRSDEIRISEADRLDSDRTFEENVYPEVSGLDNVTAKIPSGDYLRVTFSQNLTSSNDITVYARGSDGSSIEIYEEGSDRLIAAIDNVSSFGQYKVFLTNLGDNPPYTQNIFDLKSNGDI